MTRYFRWGFDPGVSLLEYLRLLITRGWIVALCAALASAAMLVYSQRQTTVYRSTMQVIFEPAVVNQDTSAATHSLLRSFVVRVHNTDVAAQIVEALGMGISPDALKGGTEISAVPDQSLIKIEVNDTDGEFANIVALAWGQALIDQQNAFNAQQPQNEQLIATIHDYPRYVQYRPRLLTNALLGGVVGVLIGAVIVFILESRMYRIVRSRHDITALTLLASVPSEPA